MFMMNYLFDFDKRLGEFAGDRNSSDPLLQSKNWLKFVPGGGISEPTPANIGTFNPELPVANWADQGDMDSGALLVPSNLSGTDEGLVGIRIGLDPSSTAVVPLGPGGVDLTLAVCFGKPSQSRQTRSSPFFDTEGGSNVFRTTFVFANQKANRPNPAAPVSWFFPLGLIKFRPTGTKHRTHRYEFSVGITVTRVTAGVTEIRHFSHDPEMDVAL